MSNLSLTIEKEKYTTLAPADVLPGGLVFPSGVYPDLGDTSSADSSYFWRVNYPRPVMPFPETYREGFIGILSDDEARKMKDEISLFKNRFDDDLARRNKILFGE